MSDQIKNGYGSFVIAASAYIVGVLLFSFWSFNAHRTALYDYVDKSLMNAAFATEEILDEALLEEIYKNGHSPSPAFIKTKSQLDRIARHGNFGSVAAGIAQRNDIDILISSSESSGTLEQKVDKDLPVSAALKAEIVSMLDAGQPDTVLLTADHPAHGAIRHAIIFKAIDPARGYIYIAEQQRGHIEQQLGDQMLRTAAVALGMVVLAIPLITLFSRTQRTVSNNLSQLNSRLQHDMANQKSRETELKDAISDLERFNAVSSGRENRIIELKAEVNELLEKMNRSKRYNIDKID